MTDDFLVRHTGLLFWAMNAMLIGYGERLLRDQANRSKCAAPTFQSVNRIENYLEVNCQINLPNHMK
jgi:hypothetical protein